jgi:hypothetical protein
MTRVEVLRGSQTVQRISSGQRLLDLRASIEVDSPIAPSQNEPFDLSRELFQVIIILWANRVGNNNRFGSRER